jgi:DNA-binding response OmpR family regulator
MPLTTRLGEEGDAPDERDTADADADAPTVLVVDDDVDMQAYLRGLLGRHYRVDAVGDLDEALARLREEDVDLVLGETGAPGTSGGALCRAVRDDDQLRHLPVLLLTARPENAARRSELEVGADAYVPMPFDPAELTARVENLIEIRRIVQTRGPVPDWLGPAETPSSSEDVAFLDALNDVVDEHIDNSNFGVDWLADEMDLSARHLRRRIKEATGLSAAGFIRARRLYHAAALLQEDTPTVADLAAAVGYRDPSYFSRLFRETFGCSPTEYAEQAPAAPDGSDISA